MSKKVNSDFAAAVSQNVKNNFRKERSDATGLYFDPNDPDSQSRTLQSDAESCDINLILERAARAGGLVENGNGRTPMYGDFTNLPNYADALQIVMDAEESFMSLDAKMRARFDNDPQKLLEFVSDASNRDEAIALGLVAAPVVSQPDPAAQQGQRVEPAAGEGPKS